MSKQQLIMQKAIELFSQKSISNTSVQDITDACGISKGAFYLSFRSKEDLLLYITDHFIKELTIAFQNTLDEDSLPKEKLEKFCFITMTVLHEKSPLLEMFLSEHPRSLTTNLLNRVQLFNESLSKIMVILLEKAYGDSIKDSIYDIHLCLKGIIHGYTDFIIHHKNNYPFRTIAKTIVSHVDAIVEKQTPPAISAEFFQSEVSFSTTSETLKNAIFAEIELCEKLYAANEFFGESIRFIKSELEKTEPNFVILNGMAANIFKEPSLKWLASLVKQYAPIT